MGMLKIYHNPQCKKSRAGLQFIKESGKPFEVVEYIRNPMTEKEMEKLLIKMNKKPADVVRTHEVYFKQNLKGKKFEDHEWIKIILQNPKLLQRPIVESKYKAVIGDPVENIEPLLK
ncbi:MAG: ArsC/Spx/MgsR family protein [Bacteroidota bacterium]